MVNRNQRIGHSCFGPLNLPAPESTQCNGGCYKGVVMGWNEQQYKQATVPSLAAWDKNALTALISAIKTNQSKTVTEADWAKITPLESRPPTFEMIPKTPTEKAALFTLLSWYLTITVNMFQEPFARRVWCHLFWFSPVLWENSNKRGTQTYLEFGIFQVTLWELYIRQCVLELCWRLQSRHVIQRSDISH